MFASRLLKMLGVTLSHLCLGCCLGTAKKKLVALLGTPGACVCVYSAMCWDWVAREGILGVGLHDALYYYGW